MGRAFSLGIRPSEIRGVAPDWYGIGALPLLQHLPPPAAQQQAELAADQIPRLKGLLGSSLREPEERDRLVVGDS